MKSEVIKAMAGNAKLMVEEVKQESGDNLVFELISCDYDKPRTSYIAAFNMYSWEIHIIYDFEAEIIYVYDADRFNVVMKCDAADNDYYSIFLWAKHYGQLLHEADSTGIGNVL